MGEKVGERSDANIATIAKVEEGEAEFEDWRYSSDVVLRKHKG